MWAMHVCVNWRFEFPNDFHITIDNSEEFLCADIQTHPHGQNNPRNNDTKWKKQKNTKLKYMHACTLPLVMLTYITCI